MTDTSTQDGRNRRLNQLVEGYIKRGNLIGVVRLIGGSVNDYRDYIPGQDDGEPPKGATW